MIGTRRNLTRARTRRHVRLTLLTTRRPRRLSIRSDARRRKSGRHRHRFDHPRKLNRPARPIRTMRARPHECSRRNRRKRRRHRMPITTRSGCVASASHSAQRLQRLLLHNHPPSIRKRPTKQQWRRSEGASSTRNQRAMSRRRALQSQSAHRTAERRRHPIRGNVTTSHSSSAMMASVGGTEDTKQRPKIAWQVISFPSHSESARDGGTG